MSKAILVNYESSFGQIDLDGVDADILMVKASPGYRISLNGRVGMGLYTFRNVTPDEMAGMLNDGDILQTSSLTNFSRDSGTMLSFLIALEEKGVRVIALNEGYDSSDRDCGGKIPFNMMKKYLETRNAELKKRGPKKKDVDELFDSLYYDYADKKITKKAFAEELGVSIPTLNTRLKERGLM